MLVASETVIVLECDLCAAAGRVVREGTETVPFALGHDYEVELCPAHKTEMHDVLAPYIMAARLAKPVRRTRTVAQRREAKAIRARAEAAGEPVPAHGRIRKDVRARFGG